MDLFAIYASVTPYSFYNYLQT